MNTIRIEIDPDGDRCGSCHLQSEAFGTCLAFHGTFEEWKAHEQGERLEECKRSEVSGEYADAIDEIEAAEIGDEITVQRCHKELARAVRGAVNR